jgi:pimeloyl-ACP methyl ester carboxylesterase
VREVTYAPGARRIVNAIDSSVVKRGTAMPHVTSGKGVKVSYDTYGSGPPLVLVHGSFSTHVTNWEFVKPHLERRFTVYAIARRGRGETDATDGHRLEDEAADAASVISAVGTPVFLLGHSYGAHTALLAATLVQDAVRKLVLYEPVWPSLFTPEATAALEALARAGDWNGFAWSFFRDCLRVPEQELQEVRDSELWAPIMEDAPATLGDLRALSRYDFVPERFRGVRCATLLQIGTESPRELYATDALAAVLPDVRIGALEGQAHEGMTTAPELYAEAVRAFLEE